MIPWSRQASPEAQRQHLLDLIERARACCSEAWPGGTHPTIRRLADLGARLSDARLRLAVLGQFKRGKSTVLNALLGTPALPTGVVPLTAIPTFIAWDDAPCLHVTYGDGRAPTRIPLASSATACDALAPYVTETGNPANVRGVAHVELLLPAAILRAGIVLIDTPGIGSTLVHNTAAAFGVLPDCDAALFVVSADPPLTEAEAVYLARAQGQVETVAFVLNKVDLLTQAERQEITDFLRRSLREQGYGEPAIFPVSARQALAAQQDGGDSVALAASGLPLVQDYLSRFLAEGKAASLRASVSRKARDEITRALGELALRVRALELPLAELEGRRAAFGEALHAIEAERLAVRDLLRGDQARLSERVRDAARDLCAEARQHLRAILDRTAAEDGGLDSQRVQDALHGAIPAFFEARLQRIAQTMRAAVESAFAGHSARTDALAETVLRSAASLFDLSFPARGAPEPFRMAQEPYWVAQRDDDAVISLTADGLARLLPPRLRASHLRRRWEARIDALAQRNVEGLRWAMLRGLDDTFRAFAAALDARLAEALDATRGAMDLTLEQRRGQEGGVSREITRLRGLSARLAALRADVGDGDTADGASGCTSP